MYRWFLRRCLARAASTQSNSDIRLGYGASISFYKASYSTLLRCTARGQPGITYCQFRYWKKVVCAIAQHGSTREHLKGQSQMCTAALSAERPSPESVNDVFERYHRLLEEGNFKPESFADFSTSLCLSVYASLGWLPWLHNDNHIISFMQILMNGRTDSLLREPLYSHKHFPAIYSHIDQNIELIPRKDCPSVLLSLIYSGLDQEDPMVTKLLSQCYKAVPELDMEQLRDLTHILQSLGGRDFLLAEKVIARMVEIFRCDPQDIRFEIKDLCVSNPVLAVYMSSELLEKCVSAMLFKMQEKSPNFDSATIGCCFRYARKMSYRVGHEKLGKIKMLGKEALDNFTEFDHLQSYQIAEICHNAKRLGCYMGDVTEGMQERSLELLRDTSGKLCVRDITNLLFAFSRDTPEPILKEICQLLIDHLDNADVLTLSNIADNMLELGLHDPDLVAMFQWKVLQNIDNIAHYITRLVKILRLLRERLEYDSAFNHQLCEVLLKLLDRRQGYDPTFVVVVAQFILPNVRTIVPAILMDCLVNVIPRCNLSLMLLILSGLDRMKGPWSRSLHNQVLEIRSQVQQNVGEQIENATHASQMAVLVKGLHIKLQSRDFGLLDRMMEHYPRVTKSMSRHDYLKTLHVFKNLSHPYYHPEVFEDLIAFIQKNYAEVYFHGVLDLVNILANAAYRPQNFGDFSTFIVQVLEDAMENENYIGQISMAHYLSIMQIFPDSVLGQIFTFDYLEEVDSIIEAEPDRRLFLKNLMMQLNRSVILECPHLDVPWFHEEYCQEQAKLLAGKGAADKLSLQVYQSSLKKSGGSDFQKNLMFVDEVESALLEVMRGLKFVGHNVYSPYYHPIDFEIVLDAAGEPVTSAAVKLLNPDELGYQRLAVMLIANQQLCANSHRRRGQYLRDKRHLEILGYRVEEIARYDWNSMALSDWGSKVNYVRNKIFPKASKDQTGSLSETTTMHPYWK